MGQGLGSVYIEGGGVGGGGAKVKINMSEWMTTAEHNGDSGIKV